MSPGGTRHHENAGTLASGRRRVLMADDGPRTGLSGIGLATIQQAARGGARRHGPQPAGSGTEDPTNVLGIA